MSMGDLLSFEYIFIEDSEPALDLVLKFEKRFQNDCNYSSV